MKRIQTSVCLLLFFAFSFLCLSSCGNSEEKKVQLTRAQKAELKRQDSLALKIAILPSSDCDFIRKADSLGVFDSLGVSVHLRQYKALSECRYALNHGWVEGALLDSTLAKIIAEKDGIDLTLGPSTSLSWKLLTSKKARIVRTEQLVDKVIAADSHGYSHLLADQTIDSLIRKDKMVYIIQCEDLTTRTRMLSTGNVDAALLPEPYATEARKSGARLLKDFSSKPQGVIAFRTAVLKDFRRKQQYDLFLKALADLQPCSK